TMRVHSRPPALRAMSEVDVRPIAHEVLDGFESGALLRSKPHVEGVTVLECEADNSIGTEEPRPAGEPRGDGQRPDVFRQTSQLCHLEAIVARAEWRTEDGLLDHHLNDEDRDGVCLAFPRSVPIVLPNVHRRVISGCLRRPSADALVFDV